MQKCAQLQRILADVCKQKINSVEQYEKSFSRLVYGAATFRGLTSANLHVCDLGGLFLAVDPRDNWTCMVNSALFTQPEQACINVKDVTSYILQLGITGAHIPLALRPTLNGTQLSKLPTIKHINAVLISVKEKTMYLIDPLGAQDAWLGNIQKEVEWFLSSFFPGYKFADITDSCPLMSVQRVASQQTFCGAWTILLLYLYISCGSYAIREIQDYLVAQGQNYLIDLMHKWICYAARFTEFGKALLTRDERAIL